MSDKQVLVPLDEVLMALYLVWEDRGGGLDDYAFLELMPHLLPLWKANKGRAEWLWARLHHVAELYGPLPEPEAALPEGRKP